MSEPIILTGSDFIGARLTKLTPCVLTILHANLFGVIPAEGDDHSDGRDLMNMAIRVAQDFPGIQVGLLNCLEHQELAELQRIYVSEFGVQCATVVFTEDGCHAIAAAYNETQESFHDWLLGILLARGSRSTVTREEIIVRLAYDIAQPPEVAASESRWDDWEIRTQAIHAARDALRPLYDAWIPGVDFRSR